MNLRRVIRATSWVLLGALLCVAPAGARERAVVRPYQRLGITAPPGCWTMRGGSPGRSGATRSPGLTGPLAQAWSFAGEGRYAGTLEGTPRVWGDRVVTAVRTQADRVFVYVLDLNTGKPLTPKLPFKATQPLEMIFDGDGLFVLERRPGRKNKVDHEVTLWRMHRGKMRRRWKHEFERPVFDMIKVRSYLAVLSGTEVTAFRPPEKDPLWSQKGCFGELAGDASGVWCIQDKNDLPPVGYKPGPIKTNLVRFLAGSGTAAPTVFLGQRIPKSQNAPFQITVVPNRVFVRREESVFPTSADGNCNTAVYRYGLSGKNRGVGLLDQSGRTVGVAGGWIVREPNEARRDELVFAYPDGKNPDMAWRRMLATDGLHAKYMRSKVPMTTAGTTVYAGLDAFDVESGEITRRSASKTVFRPIPARRCLLVSPDGRTLVAMRPKSLLSAGGTHFHDAAGGRRADAKGVALLSSETVKGTLHIEGEDLIETRGKKTEKHPLWDVSLVLDAADRVIYTHSIDDLPDNLRDYFGAQQIKPLRKLLSEAYRAKAWPLMKELISVILARGGHDGKIANLRKIANDLESKRTEFRKDKLAEIRKAQSDLETELTKRVGDALQSAIGDPRAQVREHALRVTLAHNPSHPGATKLVHERLPAWLRPQGAFDPRAWLELSEAFAHAPVTPVTAGDKTPQQRALMLAQRSWRKDLVGMQTKQLLVVTPLSKPEHLTHCLSVGELVCQAMEELFASGKSVREDSGPLVLHLFENKDEYLAAAKRAGTTESMESTAGHYSPADGLSRIFLPDHDDAFDSVMRTYAHELTHHWISERCPLFTQGERGHGQGTPGYWIIEGFADFVESFVWDVGDRTWETLNPRAEGLDVVANAPKGVLHRWSRLYAIAAVEFWRLDREPTIEIPSHWNLGQRGKLSKAHLFYRQAAATVNYLYHTSPETRAGLLGYVRAVYTGQLPPGDGGIQHFFGMTPDALGRKVEAYARDVMKGQYPK